MRIQESRENYLEAILVLSTQKPLVRSIDVANYMEFSKPSVSVAVSNLKNALLITVDSEGGLHLTEAGRALAEQIYERHTTLTRCLTMLGVSPETASEDACHIEHCISEESFARIKDFLHRMETKGE